MLALARAYRQCKSDDPEPPHLLNFASSVQRFRRPIPLRGSDRHRSFPHPILLGSTQLPFPDRRRAVRMDLADRPTTLNSYIFEISTEVFATGPRCISNASSTQSLAAGSSISSSISI